MSRLSVPNLDSATGATAEVYDQLKKAIGRVPTTFAAIGAYGPAALKAVLGADAVLASGTRQIALLTAFTMVMSGVATADVVRHHSIPEQYWGTWVAADESVIVLSAKSYVSREANCSVNWVSTTPGRRGPIHSAHLHCFGPAGKTGTRVTSNLIVWPENIDQIALGPDFKSLRVFRRCLHKPDETG